MSKFFDRTRDAILRSDPDSVAQDPRVERWLQEIQETVEQQIGGLSTAPVAKNGHAVGEQVNGVAKEAKETLRATGVTEFRLDCLRSFKFSRLPEEIVSHPTQSG